MRKNVLAGLLLTSSLRAGAGTLAAGDFLNLPLDVRSLAMGEASAAVAEGAGEISANPAALNAITADHVYLTHGLLASGINADYLSYGATAGRHHMGFSYYNVDYGTLKGADDAGNRTSDFAPSDKMYGFSYGTAVLGVDAAATLKYLDTTIVSRASAATFDVGGQYQIGEEWRLGLVGQNIGGRLKYENEGFPLPTKFSLAMGWRAMKNWCLTLDLVAPVYAPSYIAMGTEYLLSSGETGKLAFRLGTNTKTPALGAFSGLNAGLGFKFKALDMDYAVDPMGELGQAHHMAVGYHFDWPSRRNR